MDTQIDFLKRERKKNKLEDFEFRIKILGKEFREQEKRKEWEQKKI